jgi:threonine/homoserine/homoserine lactone efflux protein
MNYLSLILFTIATCGTPGPNNTMIMASGVSYGFRRSLPHVIGINIGFPVMAVAVGLGLGELLHSSPHVYTVLRPIAVAYLLYLAYRIATGPVSPDASAERRPLSVVQAALFQWINPKAWLMVIGAVTTYATVTGTYFVNVMVVALIFLVFGTPCTTFWLWLGVSLKRVLRKPVQFRAFNIFMALLLVGSLVPLLGEAFNGVRELAR